MGSSCACFSARVSVSVAVFVVASQFFSDEPFRGLQCVALLLLALMGVVECDPAFFE